MQISISRLRAYQLCPQRYYFRYILQAEDEFISSNLFFGSAIHHAIAAFHQSQNTIGSNGMYREFLKYWQAVIEDCNQKQKSIRYKANPEEFRDKAYGLCVEYVAAFKDIVACSPDDVELMFECPLFCPQSGFGSFEHTLVGKIDLVANGCVYEFKTASRTSSQKDADSSIQLTAYALAYRYLYDQPPDHLFIVNLVKTKKPKIVKLETHRGYRDFGHLIDMATSIARAIEHDIFYRNRETQWGCANCEHEKKCLSIRDKTANHKEVKT